jgi:hypothetical protein
MDKLILKDYGWCKIYFLNQKYFICFDEGQIAVKMNSYQISENQAKEAIRDELMAEKVAFEVQNNSSTSSS